MVLGWPVRSHLGAYENVEKNTVFYLFEDLEGLARALVSAFEGLGGPGGANGRSVRDPWGSLEDP